MPVAAAEDDTQEVFLNRVHPDDIPQLFQAYRLCILREADRLRWRIQNEVWGMLALNAVRCGPMR
jgi:hypothetical protein